MLKRTSKIFHSSHNFRQTPNMPQHHQEHPRNVMTQLRYSKNCNLFRRRVPPIRLRGNNRNILTGCVGVVRDGALPWTRGALVGLALSNAAATASPLPPPLFFVGLPKKLPQTLDSIVSSVAPSPFAIVPVPAPASPSSSQLPPTPKPPLPLQLIRRPHAKQPTDTSPMLVIGLGGKYVQ